MKFFYEKKFLPLRHAFAFLITLTLIVGMWPVTALPVQAVKNVPIQVKQPKPIKKELTHKRTSTTKLFDVGNGKLTKEIYFEPIHSKVGSEWKEISGDLVKSGDILKPKNTQIGVEFESKMKLGKYTTVKSDNHTLSFTLLDPQEDLKTVQAPSKSTDQQGKSKFVSKLQNKVTKEQIISDKQANAPPATLKVKDVEATFEKNEISYQNVLPHVTLRNRIYNTKVKEDMILNQYPGYNSFRFEIDTSLEAKKQKDGSITFVDSKGKTIFVLNKPYMYDSKIDPKSAEPAQSDQVEYHIQKANGKIILTVTADEKWLTDSARQYPVYIDPSVSAATSGDTYVSDRYTTTNYGADTELKVGYYDANTGKNYSYLKQDVTGISGMIIDSATLNVHVLHSYYNAPTTTGLWLDEVNKPWTESTLTWDRQTTENITSTNIGSLNVYEGQVASFNVKNTVQAWANGTKVNNGFKFHTNNNGQTYWKKLSSSESSANKPYLSITYHAPIATPPTGLAFSNWAGSDNGFVDLRWSPVQDATGYYVWMYNGKEYQKIDVGNNTYFSTHNKSIWPTAADIAAGKYQLYVDTTGKLTGGGTELAKDPTPVYQNAGNTTTGAEYIFKISAKYSGGETAPSTEYRISIPDRSEDLGTEDFWTFADVPGGDVNLVTGNLVISETDLELPGREPELAIERTYNSRSNETGPFGKGWSFNYGTKLVEDSKGNVLHHDLDGGIHMYQKNADGTYARPLGVETKLAGSKATGWTLTDKDQTIYSFDSEGKLTFIEDANKNKLTLTYDIAKQLEKVADPSGREFVFTYTNGKITQITGPDNRVWKYNYNFEMDWLVSVTDETGAISKYGYYDYDPEESSIANSIAMIIEPGDITTWFYYDDFDRLVTVIDNNESYTDIKYFPLEQKTRVYDSNITDYYYNASANPIKEVEDPDGLNLVTTYTWDHNNLTKVCDPEANKTGCQTPTQSFTYDSNGNMTKSADATGSETFIYNANNDLTEYKDPDGQSFKYLYDSKGNEIATLDPDKTTEAQVNDDKGNVLATTEEMGVGENLIFNPGMEKVTSGVPDNWTVSKVLDNGTVVADTTQKYSGNYSIKMTPVSTSASLGYAGATQELVVAPNTTYTISAMIKTQSLTNAGAFLNILQLNSSGGYSSGGWKDHRYSKVSGSQDWTQRQLTFTTAADTTKIRIYLEVDHTNSSTSGTAWFDQVQLEEGDVTTKYNPIENSSFEEGLYSWTTSMGTGTIDTTQSYDGVQSLKMTRSTTTAGAIQYVQTIPLAQKTATPITVTGLSKASGVTNAVDKKENRDYSIYVDAIQEDGVYKTDQAKFVLGTHDWQRAAVTIYPDKPLKEVRVYVLFRGNNTGTVWFDNIRMMEGSSTEKYAYDANGNYLTEVTDPTGKTEKIDYDAYGNEIGITDAKGQKTQYEYDQSNQLKKIILPGNKLRVQYSHDENGNIIEKKVTSGDELTVYNTVKYRYNNNELDTVTDELGNVTSYEYDGEGDVTSTNNPNNSVVRNQRSADGTYTEVLYNNQPVYRYYYDEVGNETKIENVRLNQSKEFTFDASERLTKLVMGTNLIEWSYSNTDQLNSVKTMHNSKVYMTSYQYNESGNNTVVTDHTGKVSRFDYDERGNIRTTVAGNGVGTTLDYDDNNQVKELTIGKSDGTQIGKFQYTYDANGNKTVIKAGTTTLNYTYDELDQLISETDPITGNTIFYTYDPLGNRTKKEVKDSAGNVISTTSYTYNAGNQLTQVGSQVYKYDANGNRIEDDKYLYTWDAGDRLTEIKDKVSGLTVASYEYDEEGRRVRSTVNGNVTNYYYDGESIRVLYETDGSNNVTRYYTYSEEGQLLSMTLANGNTYYFQLNAHGDVVAVTDQSGVEVAKYTYDAWGNIVSQTGSMASQIPFRYAGYRYDQETGFYYLISRYYQPKEGVFISADPDPGDEDDPQTQNVYTYAKNNPLKYVDPDGRWFNLVVGAAFAIYDGYKAYKKTGSIKKALYAGAVSAVENAFPVGKIFKAVKYGSKLVKAGSKYLKKYVKKAPKKPKKKQIKKTNSSNKVKKKNQKRYSSGKKAKSTKKQITKKKQSTKKSKHTKNRNKGNTKKKSSTGKSKQKKGQKSAPKKQTVTKKAPRKNEVKREQKRQQDEEENWAECIQVALEETLECPLSHIYDVNDLSDADRKEIESKTTEYDRALLDQYSNKALDLRESLYKIWLDPDGVTISNGKLDKVFEGNVGFILGSISKDGKNIIASDLINLLKSHSGVNNTEGILEDKLEDWIGKPKPIAGLNGEGSSPGYYIQKTIYTEKGKVKPRTNRDRDSEWKLFEHMTRQIMSSLNDPNDENERKSVTGEITIFTDRPMCISCQGAKKQFEKLFEGIKIKVYSNGITHDKDNYTRPEDLENRLGRKRRK